MIGNKRSEFTCDSTNNGYCFKDEDAFKNRTGVCYIPEHAFYGGDTILLSDEDIESGIENGSIETYDSIHEEVTRYLKDEDMDEEDFIKHIEECVFYEVDWQSFQTLLYEIDIYEEWNEFHKDK